MPPEPPAQLHHAPLIESQRLSIEGPAGALEVRLDTPGRPAAAPGTVTGNGSAQGAVAAVPGPEGSAAAFAVVCHPHPLFGGTLENKVVHTLARTFNDLGMPALRFNFRGVGASAGAHDGGQGEAQDALAVAAFGRSRWPGAALWLAGFSFGAAVALRACAAAQPARLIAIAPAVDRVETGVVSPRCPWLIVLGDADDVVAPAAVLEWAARAHPGPQLQVLAGAGHYFHGRLPELRAAVTAFANQKPG